MLSYKFSLKQKKTKKPYPNKRVLRSVFLTGKSYDEEKCLVVSFPLNKRINKKKQYNKKRFSIDGTNQEAGKNPHRGRPKVLVLNDEKGEILLLGTNHHRANSAAAVNDLFARFKTHVVVVELCKTGLTRFNVRSLALFAESLTYVKSEATTAKCESAALDDTN